ncbi:MAG TPA: hypothetical protein VHE54_18060 [Puia sp.]|nr:hypothetical protein [Puia sp.]
MIASDDRRPFYVRVDSQFYSSTPQGHLLIAPLKDSDYLLSVGFPGQDHAEQRYDFGVHHKDWELQLRKQDDGNWKLYDMQGQNWITAQEPPATETDTRAGVVKKDDAFSRMMAGVVHDTAVLYNSFAMEQALADSDALAKKIALSDSTKALAAHDSAVAVDTREAAVAGNIRDSAAAGKMRDTAVAATTGDSAAGLKMHDMTFTARTNFSRDSAPGGKALPATRGRLMADTSSATMGSSLSPAGPAPVLQPAVVKLSEKKSSRALRQVYTDQTAAGRTDTVEVIIPVDSASQSHHRGSSPSLQSTDSSRRLATASSTPHSTDSSRRLATASPSLHSTDSAVTSETPRTVPADTARESSKPLPYINSDCHNFATTYDVDKLRVKMLDAASDDDRITAARKVFKIKCFYTSQISALSEVFATDEAKFRFFEIAWPFAADEHFRELSQFLRDPVYIGKFKTMTGQQ